MAASAIALASTAMQLTGNPATPPNTNIGSGKTSSKAPVPAGPSTPTRQSTSVTATVLAMARAVIITSNGCYRVRQQGDRPRALDRRGERALMQRARAGDATRHDLA